MDAGKLLTARINTHELRGTFHRIGIGIYLVDYLRQYGSDCRRSKMSESNFFSSFGSPSENEKRRNRIRMW